MIVYRILDYKGWNRYYYITSVSNPKAFPINIQGIWFNLPNGELASACFHKSEEMVNGFYSDWGRGAYDNAYSPEFLPQSLFVEYIDFRTKQYYADTIALPQENMLEIFKRAEKDNDLKNLSAWNPKMGLEFQVGIANGGNIVFWLMNDHWEKEFYRTQLQPKPFPTKMQSNQKPINSKEEFLSDIFAEIPDSVKTDVLKTSGVAQFKDSIPIYFNDLRK
ncbi:DUF2931 family protein [Sphingobacterium corticis]|uniref:DUF2931 family protein n=1 Tax=Sphingobacterium corticis TaxID=1812823 RepID=A0ABW5NFK1_9SPHI